MEKKIEEFLREVEGIAKEIAADSSITEKENQLKKRIHELAAEKNDVEIQKFLQKNFDFMHSFFCIAYFFDSENFMKHETEKIQEVV
ncbi:MULTISPECIES: hypothetical protein [Thermodesulfovibrio]|jgi:hypothetical protein|uniref:hypothetical protein n=1 Tax=Thermodesulfovibrio TaxID=28261 RepID=UPI00261B222A|nr:hypothetical protein [Thermodesulfovibrio sp.]